jgi:hypothetical protein
METLSFTIVTGHLRGDHACPFEVHATGCRDLKKMQATQPSREILAPTPNAAIAEGLEEFQGLAVAKDFWIQPCCCLSRMRAAGRA